MEVLPRHKNINFQNLSHQNKQQYAETAKCLRKLQ